jgi:hypothetical protein
MPNIKEAQTRKDLIDPKLADVGSILLIKMEVFQK